MKFTAKSAYKRIRQPRHSSKYLSLMNKLKQRTLYKYFQLCDTSPDNDENSQIYSAPVAELGSTTNLTQCENQENDRNGDKGKLSTTSKKSHSSVAPNKNSRQSEDNVSYCDQK